MPTSRDEVFTRVADRLRHLLPTAIVSYEYPGYLEVALPDGQYLAVGTANGNWGADIYTTAQAFESREASEVFDMPVPAASQDAVRIADLLFLYLGVRLWPDSSYASRYGCLLRSA